MAGTARGFRATALVKNSDLRLASVTTDGRITEATHGPGGLGPHLPVNPWWDCPSALCACGMSGAVEGDVNTHINMQLGIFTAENVSGS